MPTDSTMPSIAIDMNFCPSCAPCMNARNAPAATLSGPNTRFAVGLRIRAHAIGMSLEIPHPMPNPSTVDTSRP